MSDSNLGSPNTFWRVTAPFQVYLQVDSVPSNAWYGNARIFQPVFSKTTMTPGDELHNLWGGLYAVVRGKVYRVHMEEPEWAPFEHGGRTMDRFPLDKLEELRSGGERRVNYNVKFGASEWRLDGIAARVAARGPGGEVE